MLIVAGLIYGLGSLMRPAPFGDSRFWRAMETLSARASLFLVLVFMIASQVIRLLGKLGLLGPGSKASLAWWIDAGLWMACAVLLATAGLAWLRLDRRP